ncbi:MAG: peptidylprolyl isomerase [Candidatus Thorarchaeota archaeon]|jgi:peptidyl-prolyl cis-trans isomerase B (cyclophilin B)
MTTRVKIETNRGTITTELWSDDAINTVKNFVTLAQKGYYDGVTFHRVIDNFVVQGGDPTGTGSGGPGYAIPCETRGHRQKHDFGALSMAHAGRDTGGSQYFVCLSREKTKHLDGKHTVFGQVTEGLEILPQIQAGDKMLKVKVIEVDPAIEAHELQTMKSWR